MDLTYIEVGRTRDDVLPAGFRHARRHTVVGSGEEAFQAVAAGMRRYMIHRLAGAQVRADDLAPVVGGRFQSGIGLFGMRLWAPCQFVWISDTPTEYGYGFGTLPGHPVRGEEAFLVQLDRHGRVHFRLRAFSRPATLTTRIAGPITTLAQRLAYDRYLASAHKLTQVQRT
jgi:uncharacterized protein (UPF0548 family)